MTWDLNVEGALGARFTDRSHVSGFGRVRGGLLFANEVDIAAPTFFMLDLSYELSDFSPATFGLQAEVLSLNSGLSLQLGALVDVQPRPGFMASLGFSVFGVEGQLRWAKDGPEGPIWAIYGKISIPIGVIRVALQ